MSNPFLHSYFCYPRPLLFGALIAWTLACGVFGWLIGTAQRRRTPNYTELIIVPGKDKPVDLRTGSPEEPEEPITPLR